MLGHDRKVPVEGKRKGIEYFITFWHARAALLVAGVFRITYSKLDYDYAPYLGKDYKNSMPEEAPAIINNHSHFCDIISVFVSGYVPCFVAKKEV